MAVIDLLEATAHVDDELHIFCDSQYVIKGMTEWLSGWKRKGWKTGSGEPVKNRELWEGLEAACKPHKIRWQWVKGHAGHEYNERCDRLAKAEAMKFRAAEMV